MTQPTPVTPTSKRRRDPKSTRERLVRAALELFTSQGYHQSTTPQIAKRAGVAEGTIYRHFESKGQLLNEIYRGAVDLFTRVITEAPAAIPCQQRLQRVASGWIEVAARDPGLVKLVFVASPEQELDGRSRVAFGTLRSELETVLASGKAAGEVRPGPVELWADVWLQLIRLVLHRVAKQEWSLDQAVPQQVVASAWDAVATPGQPSAD